ncbi:dihydrofolate reductase [Salisediminibacterium halotolerans]|uniref:Dihydrofolate reductase n=1 Tax=Salisediminibacterium halotolerans TaxID=517425 RepID=A0A1H9VMG4_9BACI|nr:dihydrofolate reductase [Salisediminibacterium haloalkalitolerans]SES22782.1 dihydrofolate reductase [Salisediminibacterium haloalkalitolerans]
MIRLIAAMDQCGIIGSNGAMPWHLPNDLKFFKETTEGKPILMGRKTFLSIGRPLPKRENIVVTSNRQFSAEGVAVHHDLDQALQLIDEQDGFVIGGAEIYQYAIAHADELYITVIEETFAGDTYFPDFSLQEWELTWEQRGSKDEKNPYPHVFRVYKRINT